MTNPLLDSPLKPPPPPSELDELMSRDPLTLSAQDIDKIIQYQRAQRARREAGKGKKSQLSDGAGIDLAAMIRGDTIPKVVSTTVPTVAGFRRI
jgi:hypothetical protein